MSVHESQPAYSGRMGSRADQKQQTRQAILRAAAEALAEGGVKNASLVGIGKRAGVAHTTVLYHFGSVHELLVAVLKERDRLFLEQFVGESWTGGGFAALLNLPANGRFCVDNPELTKLFTVLLVENFDPSQPLHDYFLARQRLTRDINVAMMRAAIEAGDMRDDVDVEAKADEILSFQTGAQIMWALDPEHCDLVQMYEAYTEGLRADLAR